MQNFCNIYTRKENVAQKIDAPDRSVFIANSQLVDIHRFTPPALIIKQLRIAL